MAKLMFFDIETTGLCPVKNSAHQIAYRIEEDGRELASGNLCFKPRPGAEVSPEALEACGVTMEDLRARDMTYAQAYEGLLQTLDKAVDRFDRRDKMHLVGYNNRRFDDGFLRGMFLDNENTFFGSYFFSDSLDVMVLASWRLMHGRKFMRDFKLGTVYAEVAGKQPDAGRLHDAGYDLELTVEMYKALTDDCWGLF